MTVESTSKHTQSAVRSEECASLMSLPIVDGDWDEDLGEDVEKCAIM